MNIVGILAVGNEILDGLTLETNSQWLINRLKPLNFKVKETIVVRDDVSMIANAVNRLIEDGCSVVFTTGGLGPTFDDITLEGVAKAFGLSMELNEDALDIVTRQYRDLYEKGVIDTDEITAARRKMAVLPKGATPLDNKAGGAPGVLLQIDKVVIICLPGVPKELKWIFNHQALPLVKKHVKGVFKEEVIYLPLRDESTLAPIIDEVMKEVPDVYIKSMVKPYGEHGIRLWISARGQDEKLVEQRVERVVKLLLKITGERLK